MVTEQLFDSKDQQYRQLSKQISEVLQAAINERGQASLIVSGGSTPLPLYQQLSKEPIDWSRVWITLADERWVDASDPTSNEFQIRSNLLQNRAANAQFLPLKPVVGGDSIDLSETEAALNTWPFPADLLLLGMGNDGHTASLFPDAPELGAGLDLQTDHRCLLLRPASSPYPRISLTLPALLSCRQIILMICGDDKWQVYQKALGALRLEVTEEEIEEAVEEMPIQAFLRQDQVPVSVSWSP
ncbi:MAG: 6-phosphogluconolactonase [Pseudomonadales bacterium]|nr:6-phosphogluconolactonase [Pseudomonadales bacterium]